MYKRLSNFLRISNMTYLWKFAFRQKYPVTHILINLTESIICTHDEGSFGCGTILYLQKAFEIVDHKTLLQSYLLDRQIFVSINGYNSYLVPIDFGVPQGSVLRSLFSLICINDLHRAIQCCKVHHFADDAKLFHTSKSVESLNKLVNRDMKHLNQ